MNILKGLQPENVWAVFERISEIPHGSGNMEKIGCWLMEFAEENHIRAQRDQIGNVILYASATPGYEAAPTVILQAHMDMVCALEPGCSKDMAKEGLELFVDDGKIGARGTTLGGDDGIGVAIALALLTDATVQHPALEVVLTVDEETGMDGAKELDGSLFSGRRLLNLDNEEEGVFTVSCAGGVIVNAQIPIERELSPGQQAEITLSGLTGGHSGVEIKHGRGNANVLMGRVLYRLSRQMPLRLVSVYGGQKNNAIPMHCTAVVSVSDADMAAVACSNLERAIRAEYALTDPNLKLEVREARSADTAMTEKSTQDVISILQCVPDGVLMMSKTMENMVQTSSNLGILQTEAGSALAQCCVRSSVESQKQAIVERIASLTERAGGKVTTEGDYPGWDYQPESAFRNQMVDVYRRMYGSEPEIHVTHAGMECGLICGKIPGLDCVSAGPTVTDIHTFRERLDIASVLRTYQYLCAVLAEMKA